MANKIISTAISAVLTMGMAQTSALAENTNKPSEQQAKAMEKSIEIPDMEKCYGIAKAGMNDCGTMSHYCTGEQKVDADKKNWMLVPKGLCNKIVGGSLTPPADSQDKK